MEWFLTSYIYVILFSYWVIGAECLSEYGLRGEAQITLFEPHPSMSHIYSMLFYASNDNNLQVYSPPLSASKPLESQHPRSGSALSEQVRSPWEWGFEHSSGSKIYKDFQPPFGTLGVHCWAIHCKHHSWSSGNIGYLSFNRKIHDLYNIRFFSTNPWQYTNWRSTRL